METRASSSRVGQKRNAHVPTPSLGGRLSVGGQIAGARGTLSRSEVGLGSGGVHNFRKQPREMTAWPRLRFFEKKKKKKKKKKKEEESPLCFGVRSYTTVVDSAPPRRPRATGASGLFPLNFELG